MKKQSLVAVAALTLVAGVIAVSPATAGTAPRDPNLNGGVILGPVLEAPLGTAVNWIDHFDLYALDSQIHGQGGWTGWGNTAVNGAFVRDAFSRTAPHSVEVAPTSDLVHEYAGYTAGTWTFTAYQYIPTGFTGMHYFIMLNTYTGATPTACDTCNWSVQVPFDSVSGTVGPDFGPCVGPTASIVLDQWVPIRLVIDLDADTFDFFYNDALLYTCSWTEGATGGGAVNIGAVDLFGNGSTAVYYDDVSLSNLDFLDGFESGNTNEWHFTQP